MYIYLFPNKSVLCARSNSYRMTKNCFVKKSSSLPFWWNSKLCQNCSLSKSPFVVWNYSLGWSEAKVWKFSKKLRRVIPRFKQKKRPVQTWVSTVKAETKHTFISILTRKCLYLHTASKWPQIKTKWILIVFCTFMTFFIQIEAVWIFRDYIVPFPYVCVFPNWLLWV